MMFFCGFVLHVLFFILPRRASCHPSGISKDDSSDKRKVIVQEIRFSVSPKDFTFNVSVKNGIADEAYAPDTRRFHTVIANKEEYENTLLKQYFERLLADPFYKGSKFVERGIKNSEVNNNLKNLQKETDENSSHNEILERDYISGKTYKQSDLKRNDLKRSDENNENDKDQKDINEKDVITRFTEKSDEDASKVDGKEPASKIVGGTQSLPTTWPWQVSIQYYGADDYWHHFCGGSLIHNRWVITAAHCVCTLEDYTIRVVLGDYRLSVRTYREQIIDPTRILMHAYYEETSYYFDIAMIKLSESAMSTSYVGPVEMSTPKMDTFSENDLCYITGWGNTIGTTERVHMSDYLLQSQVSVISKSSCRQTYGHIIEDTQICIMGENVSACSGDSGGPLVCQVGKVWKLVGTASWVGSDTCSSDYPNVYTRMSAFYEWAESVMEQY